MKGGDEDVLKGTRSNNQSWACDNSLTLATQHDHVLGILLYAKIRKKLSQNGVLTQCFRPYTVQCYDCMSLELSRVCPAPVPNRS